MRVTPATWNQLATPAKTKPIKCAGCPLYHKGRGPVLGAGPSPSPLAIIGDCPDQEDVYNKRPFTSPNGRILTIAMIANQLPRERVWLTYLCKCYVRGITPPEAIEFCHKAWLLDELKEVRPNAVMALGETVLNALTGYRLNIMTWRGSVTEI